MIYRSWLAGRTFSDLAKSHTTHRQTTRAIVLSFKPRLEDYRMHDYACRQKQFELTLRPKRRSTPKS